MLRFVIVSKSYLKLTFDFWDKPSPSEIEVSIFGKGYGECILIHTGDGRWIIIDSFKDETKQPIAMRYLQSIGVKVDSDVTVIAASHWHDDHISGLAEALEVCPKAKFALPLAMMQDEFTAFATKYANDGSTKLTSGVRELTRILELVDARKQPLEWSMSWRIIHKENSSDVSHGHDVLVSCMSPSNSDVRSFLQTVKADAETPAKYRQRAPSYSRNDISVAMWISIGPATILLGADLENRLNADSGWKAVLASSQLPTEKAQVMKISHHGSVTGHHDKVWSDLCIPEVTASLTPWAKGGGRLPSQDDLKRILSLTPNGYATNTSAITTSKERMRMVGGVIRDQGAKIRKIETKLGHIRHRYNLGHDDPQWQTKIGGQACSIRHVHG